MMERRNKCELINKKSQVSRQKKRAKKQTNKQIQTQTYKRTNNIVNIYKVRIREYIMFYLK